MVNMFITLGPTPSPPDCVDFQFEERKDAFSYGGTEEDEIQDLDICIDACRQVCKVSHE